MPIPTPTFTPALPPNSALNAICAYFTMFPLSFPLAILQEHAHLGDWVLDPFCGRGTTNLAARLLGLPSTGIDSHPLAAALSEAKLVTTTPSAIVAAAHHILESPPAHVDLPSSDFWALAFHPDVLYQLCVLRSALLHDCRSSARKALRAIILGALHGPLAKSSPSYFSNQMTRTFAPKPAYAVRFWQSRNLQPPPVDVLALIATRAHRYYGSPPPPAIGRTLQADSRDPSAFSVLHEPVRWVITSPPYYGMRTYLPDQWLRLWFLGGPSEVDYINRGQLQHSSPQLFASNLRQVWRNAASVAHSDARMVIRFGGINDRRADPLAILHDSLRDSGWRVDDQRPAGSAAQGRRQALHFATTNHQPIEEVDFWTSLESPPPNP